MTVPELLDIYTSINPYSEAQSETLKYRPDFPPRFESLQAARAFCRGFFPWYNHDHRHAGLGLLPPAVVHAGQAEAVHAARRQVLAAAYARHPERFVRRAPAPPPLPTAAWINPPPHRLSPPSTTTSSSSPLAPATVGPVSNSVLFVSQTP
jgi:putative transposase